MKLHPKIIELKRRAAPIQYSSSTISKDGKLEKFSDLLEERIVCGYGCVWGSTNNHKERFHKGAFERSIKENGPGSGASYEIKFRDNHGRAMALFEELREDEVGLFFRTKPLDNVSWADDALTQLKSGTINNFSNGFLPIFERGAIEWNEKEELVEFFQARLFEISTAYIPSDFSTFALRNVEEEEELLYEETESFIKSLPKKSQLELRRLIARHKSLAQDDTSEQIEELKDEKPMEKRGIDYNYLTQNFSLK
jgi:HK97 family phage prohead protease